MNLDEFREYVWDELQRALDEDRLTIEQLKAITAILETAAERKKRGGPSAAETEKN